MISLQRVGPPPGSPRLASSKKLTVSDFMKVALELGAYPMKARKVGFVAVRRAAASERVTTLWNGKETTAVAEAGDMIVTNMSADREILRDAAGNANVYVILAGVFPKLYERDTGENEFGEVFRARVIVDALYLPGGFEIMAPWGEIQRADAGYLIKNGDEVYGNHKETFEQTYVSTLK